MGVKLGPWKLGVNEKGGRFPGLLGGKLSIFTRQLVIGHYYGPWDRISCEKRGNMEMFRRFDLFLSPIQGIQQLCWLAV